MPDRDIHRPSDRRGAPEETLESSPVHSALDSDLISLAPGDELSPVHLDSRVDATDAAGAGTVDRYELRKELGRGGMGVVYRAHDAQLGRDVALKLLLAGVHATEHSRKRFLREARAVASLRHPNIVQIHDIGVHEDTVFFTMELVDGPTLTRVVRTRAFDARQAAAVAIRLARALACAHERGLVHRDVKPGNVLLDTSWTAGDASVDESSSGINDGGDGADGAAGRPVLTDFGLVKDIHAGDDSAFHTRDGAFLGTPEYMAPEQLRGDIEAIGPHTDQYALGVVLWELASGRRPYPGNTPGQLLERSLRDEAPALDHGDVPTPLRRICEKALASAPGARYSDCAALADDLERFLSGEPVLAAARGPLWHARRLFRRYRRALAILCLVAVSVGAAVWALGALREWRATRAERARQAAAEQRRVAMQASVDALTAADRPNDDDDDDDDDQAMAEAERMFAGFVELKANAETRALARAWLDRAALLKGRSQAVGDDATLAAQGAYATAYGLSEHRSEQAAALLGLAELFRGMYRWRSLGEAMATLTRRAPDVAVQPKALRLRRDLALVQRRFADASALVASGSSAVEHRDARLLARLGRATRTAHQARVANLWDIDGDGASELVLATDERTSLTVVDADDPTLPVRLRLDLPAKTRPIQSLAPVRRPAAEPPTLLITEQGNRSRLVQLSAGRLDVVAPPLSGSTFGVTSGDLDGDGALDHYVAQNMNILSLVPQRDGETFAIDIALPHTDTARTAMRDLAMADLDGDGRAELLAATAEWAGYDLRVYHAAAPGLQLVARHQLGEVVQVEVIRAPGELRAAVVQEHEPAVPLDRRMFPDDGPHGAARGIHVLALTSRGWQRRTSIPLGRLFGSPRGRKASQMQWLWPSLLAGDLDGDRLDDLVAVFKGTWMIIFHQHPDGTFSELIVDGTVPLAIRDIDGDGAAELVVHTADAAADVWVLGLGDDRVPPVLQAEGGETARDVPGESAIRIERDVEPALREHWRRAEEMDSMGLPVLAAERLAHIASLAAGTLTEARALFRAGAMHESTARSPEQAQLAWDTPLADASALYRRAATALANGPDEQPSLDLLALMWDAALRVDLADQRHDAALDAAKTHPSLPAAPGAPTGELAETVRWLENMLAVSSIEFDFTTGLDDRWRVHRPFDVRLDRQAGGLRVRTFGDSPLLSLSVRRTDGPVRITLDVSAQRTDWASVFYVALIPDNQRARGASQREPGRQRRIFQWATYGGGGVYFERFICAGAASRKLPGAEAPARRRRRLTWEFVSEKRGGSCEVAFADSTLRGVFRASSRTDIPERATLIIGGDSLDGAHAMTESLLHRLELVGLDISRAQPDPLAHAHHELAIGRPDLALGTLDAADEMRVGRSVAADVARATAFAELGQARDAHRVLVAALDRDSHLDGSLFPLMHHHLDSFESAVRAVMGPRYYARFFAVHDSTLGQYANQARGIASLVAHLDGLEELPLDTFTEPSDALRHLILLDRRGAAWRLENRAARGYRTLVRARELGRYWLAGSRLAGQPGLRAEMRQEMAFIGVELAIIHAQRGEHDRAIASLLDALAISPAPTARADKIANRRELEVLHTHPRWPEVWRARKVGEWPGTR